MAELPDSTAPPPGDPTQPRGRRSRRRRRSLAARPGGFAALLALVAVTLVAVGFVTLSPAGEPADVVAPTILSSTDGAASPAGDTASEPPSGSSPSDGAGSGSLSRAPTGPTALGEPTSASAAEPRPTGASSGGAASPTATAAVTIAAVGDMVCDPDGAPDGDGNGLGPQQCQQQAVSDLVLRRRPTAFLALGDNQYSDGTLQAYRTSYARSFGRLLGITRPVPGNHEYDTPNAAGYYRYFGARAGSASRGYYSYDLAGWHVVALNSNCGDVSCRAGAAQERWLRADLAAHPARCTLAYYHYPRWSHGEHGDNPEVAPLLQALYDAGAEVVLNGHDHDYERYVPRAPSGAADPARGVREVIVGTGGRSLRAATGGAGTEAINSDSFGALFLELSPTSYSWTFMPVNGSRFTDSGRAACH